jgi:hypothetical protein
MTERRPGILGKIDTLRQRKNTREIAYNVIDGKPVRSDQSLLGCFESLLPDARIIFQRAQHNNKWKMTGAFDAEGEPLPANKDAVLAYLSGRKGFVTSNTPPRHFTYDDAGKPAFEIRPLFGKFPTE